MKKRDNPEKTVSIKVALKALLIILLIIVIVEILIQVISKDNPIEELFALFILFVIIVFRRLFWKAIKWVIRLIYKILGINKEI